MIVGWSEGARGDLIGALGVSEEARCAKCADSARPKLTCADS